MSQEQEIEALELLQESYLLVQQVLCECAVLGMAWDELDEEQRACILSGVRVWQIGLPGLTDEAVARMLLVASREQARASW